MLRSVDWYLFTDVSGQRIRLFLLGTNSPRIKICIEAKQNEFTDGFALKFVKRIRFWLIIVPIIHMALKGKFKFFLQL
jgi:hypothetical protein